MKKFLIGLLGAYGICNAIGFIVAKFLLNPMLSESFGDLIRPEDHLDLVSLEGGYLVLSLMMVIAFQYFSFKGSWVNKGLLFGVLCGGLTFLSDHMITAGWSNLPITPMLISGIIDISITISIGLFIAFVYKDHE